MNDEILTDYEIDTGTRDDESSPPADSNFCHIEDGSGHTYYCGRPITGETTCKIYEGEAICPTCGLPTCPQCSVMSSLNERLVES